MKKLFTLSLLLLAGSQLYAQQNELPVSGDVGIGTTNPEAKLDVSGDVKIDSTLTVNDNATLKMDLKVEGQSRLTGDVQVMEGKLILKYLMDSTLLSNEVLFINEFGEVVRGGDLLELVYKNGWTNPLPDGTMGPVPCYEPPVGQPYIVPDAIWNNGPGKLFTYHPCIPDPLVGIGTNNPKAKLHIVLNDEEYDTHPFLIEKRNGEKVLQVTENGLLYAREVKVNLDSAWPDYVFEPTYELMSLEQLKTYLNENKHLPNVPSAEQMEQNGLNLGENDRMLMEKIEELTLYMLQLQEQLKQQQELLLQQQTLIEQLQQPSTVKE